MCFILHFLYEYLNENFKHYSSRGKSRLCVMQLKSHTGGGCIFPTLSFLQAANLLDDEQYNKYVRQFLHLGSLTFTITVLQLRPGERKEGGGAEKAFEVFTTLRGPSIWMQVTYAYPHTHTHTHTHTRVRACYCTIGPRRKKNVNN